MKKEYKPPKLYFDRFELSSSIATGCAIRANNAEYVCPVKDPDMGITIFATAPSPCSYTPGPNDKTPCYDVPSAGANIFTS